MIQPLFSLYYLADTALISGHPSKAFNYKAS